MGGFRKEQVIAEILKSFFQPEEICLPSLDELRQLFQLRDANRCLHIGQLQVVANMRVRVLVIEAARQFSQLPSKPFPAGVVFPWLAPAITSPVTKRFDQRLQRW